MKKDRMTNDFEQTRLQNLEALLLMNKQSEKEFNDLTSLASLICGTPISLVTLLTATRQVFISHHGLDLTEAPIDQSFCTHAIKVPEDFFTIEDARKDARFKKNPLVTGSLNIVFYAGIALVSNDGSPLGVLCVMDNKARKLDQKQMQAMRSLANQVVKLFELNKKCKELKEVSNDFEVESHRLRNNISATQVGTWEWDIHNDKVIINERWAEILGYTMAELNPIESSQFHKFLYFKDAAFAREQAAACREKKVEYYEGDFRYVHKKGHLVWVYIRGQVISWSNDGQALIMAGTNMDITKRVNTDTQFNNITSNIPGVVFRYKLYSDGKDELLLVSKGAKNIWGYTAEEVMQDSNLIWERTNRDDADALLKSIQKSAEGLSHWEHEWRQHHPDGTTRWHKGSGTPSLFEGGSTVWDIIVLDITDEKEAELKIEKSEKRFKGLVQNGSDLVTIFDLEGNLQYASPTSLKVFGMSPEVLIAKNVFEYIHPDDKEEVSASLLLLKSEKQLVLKPYRFKHSDGSWRWLETFVTNLMDDPSVEGMVGNSKDISPRIVAEEKLKISEAYYRGFYESLTSYIIRTDMEGNYTYVNKKFVEEFGWLHPKGEILGSNCFPSIMEYDLKKMEETVVRCIAEPEKVFKVEIDKQSRDGLIIVTLWEFVCVTDAEGVPYEIQCMGLNITDQIKAEKEVKESEQRYTDLFHLSPQPQFVYETDTLRFLAVNDATIAHYGYSHQEFMKMSIEEIRPKSELPKLKAILKQPQKNGRYSLRGDFVHSKKNGEEILVEVRSNMITYLGKEAKVVLVTDITERRQYVRAMEAQNKKLKKIAWTQSHVVRSPLTNIMGLAEMLKNDGASFSEKEKEEFLDHLLFSANTLDEVIRGIVVTSQLEVDRID